MGDLLLREICRITGVSRRAIQGYEKECLVMPCGKNKYGYLLYSSTTIERIKEIKLYQERGFTLKEIKVFAQAEEEFLENTAKDEVMLSNAQQRVELLLEEYVRNIGKLFEKNYTIQWIHLDADGNPMAEIME